MFSDSIGVGQYISPHKTWVHKLSAWLGDDWLVINASRNGDTTRLALERMRYDVLSQSPDIVYIQFGINDANVWADANGFPRVRGGAFLENLCEIIERVRKVNALPVLATNDNIKVAGGNLFITQAAIVGETQLIVHRYNEPTLLSDNVHLSERGHQLYYERIRDEINWA